MTGAEGSGSDEAVPDQSEQLDLDPDEMLVSNGRDDMLDGGYEVPDHWSAGQGFGNTPEEQAEGETLDQRLAQEEPDVGQEPVGAPTASTVVDSDVTELDLVGQEDLDNTVDDVHESIAGGSLEAELDPELDEESDGSLFAGTESIDDDEVGDDQVTRLVAPDEGSVDGGGDEADGELLGLDAGDSEEQSAEEAAVHVVPGS